MLKLLVYLGIFVVAVYGEGEECSSKMHCGRGMSCDANMCYDPCKDYCGGNTTCRVYKHHPVCACEDGYSGDPLHGCVQGAGCSDNNECADDKVCVSAACVDPCQGACDEDLFCEVKGHTATCIKPTNIIPLYTSADLNYEYQFLPISSGSRIKFRVKCMNDAHIMLAEKSNPTGSDPYYECVVGGWGNTKSVIRKDRNVAPKAEVSTIGIVDEVELSGFWIDYSKSTGYIAVGREGEETPFMSWTDPEPLDVKFMGLASGFGSYCAWYTYEEGCIGSRGCAEDRVCSNGVCYNPCHLSSCACEDEYFCQVESQVTSCFKPGNVHRVSTSVVEFNYIYFPAPKNNSIIKFKVKAKNDAHFLIAESSKPNFATDKFWEIVIGGWANTNSVIRDKREGGDKDKEYFPGIVSEDEYRGFWVQYLDGKLSVGKMNEKNPFLNVTDSKPLNFKYWAISTGFGSRGKWILYD